MIFIACVKSDIPYANNLAVRLDELNIEHTTGVLDSPDPRSWRTCTRDRRL